MLLFSATSTMLVPEVKYLLDNQITPDGSDPNPLTCENESYVYAVNRYDVDTQKYSLIYAAARADFPAPEKWTAYSWKLAFDETRQRLYWWFYAGACAVVRTCDAPLYYIDVSGLSDDGAMPTPVSAANITDGYGHAAWLGFRVCRRPGASLADGTCMFSVSVPRPIGT